MSAKDSSSTVGTSEAPSGACLLEPTVDHTSAPLGLRWCLQKRQLKTQASGESQDHCNGKQRRIALNGKAYNRLQFRQYYGKSWEARWNEALVDTQGGAPQPAEAPITTCNAINELPEEPFMTSIERPTEAHKATSIAPTDSSSRCASEPTERLCPLGSCMGIQLSSLTDSEFLGLASARQDEDQRRLRRDVRWDPLGLPRFLPPKRQKTQTSGEDQRVARTGSRRGASQLAPTASPTVVERPEEDHQHAHVSLLGALHGERYGVPGGGEAPEVLVPVRRFLAEHILGKRLVKLTRTQEGWAPLQDEATGKPVLSPAPVSAFVGGDNRPYVSGSLARIANEHRMVFVMFSDQPLRVQVRVGTYNVGMVQEMLDKERHQNSLRGVIAESFIGGDLHLLSLCEVGGHMRGLQDLHISPLDFINGVLRDGEYHAAAVQAYMNVWHQAGAAQPGGVSLQPSKQPTCLQLRPDLAADPQLVIFDFHVTAEQYPGMMGRLVHGVLHIGSNRRHMPSWRQRTIVTRQALRELEDSANSGALQPTVCVLTGDMNLDRYHADTVVQPDCGELDVLNRWHTQTSAAALPGDVAFIRGTPSEAFEIEIGRSYPNRGIRHDMHDCFGFELRIPLVHMV